MTVTNLYFKNFNISDHIKAKGTDYWDDFKYLFILPTTHYHHICLTLWNTQAIQPDCLPDWTSLHATCQRSKESLLWPDVSFWTSEFRFSGSVKTVAHCCLSWKPHHGLRNWLFISNCLDLAWANLLSFVPADAITRHCLLPGCQTAVKYLRPFNYQLSEQVVTVQAPEIQASNPGIMSSNLRGVRVRKRQATCALCRSGRVTIVSWLAISRATHVRSRAAIRTFKWSHGANIVAAVDF